MEELHVDLRHDGQQGGDRLGEVELGGEWQEGEDRADVRHENLQSGEADTSQEPESQTGEAEVG